MISGDDVVRRGETIYRERYQRDFEDRFRGKFVAIDVDNGDATISDRPEEALHEAEAKDPSGYFYLLRVGYPAAFGRMDRAC